MENVSKFAWKSAAVSCLLGLVTYLFDCVCCCWKEISKDCQRPWMDVEHWKTTLKEGRLLDGCSSSRDGSPRNYEGPRLLSDKLVCMSALVRKAYIYIYVVPSAQTTSGSDSKSRESGLLPSCSSSLPQSMVHVLLMPRFLVLFRALFVVNLWIVGNNKPLT